MNPAFDPQEIDKLKKECIAEEQNYVLVEDEEGLYDSGEVAQINFVGTYEGKPCFYDALLVTLRVHHSEKTFEKAEEQVIRLFPEYQPLDNRKDDYVGDEETELLLEELIEQYEEEETVKVAEFMEFDPQYEYGIGLQAAFNVEEITHEFLTKFVNDFNQNKLKLDPTLYSFTNEEED